MSRPRSIALALLVLMTLIMAGVGCGERIDPDASLSADSLSISVTVFDQAPVIPDLVQPRADAILVRVAFYTPTGALARPPEGSVDWLEDSITPSPLEWTKDRFGHELGYFSVWESRSSALEQQQLYFQYKSPSGWIKFHAPIGSLSGPQVTMVDGMIAPEDPQGRYPVRCPLPGTTFPVAYTPGHGVDIDGYLWKGPTLITAGDHSADSGLYQMRWPASNVARAGGYSAALTMVRTLRPTLAADIFAPRFRGITLIYYVGTTWPTTLQLCPPH